VLPRFAEILPSIRWLFGGRSSEEYDLIDRLIIRLSLSLLLCPFFLHFTPDYWFLFLAYTKLLKEIKQGNLQNWKTQPAPLIAKNYWQLAENATVLDVFENIRADESHHRYVFGYSSARFADV
jgi:hypothetical protein